MGNLAYEKIGDTDEAFAERQRIVSYIFDEVDRLQKAGNQITADYVYELGQRINHQKHLPVGLKPEYRQWRKLDNPDNGRWSEKFWRDNVKAVTARSVDYVALHSDGTGLKVEMDRLRGQLEKQQDRIARLEASQTDSLPIDIVKSELLEIAKGAATETGNELSVADTRYWLYRDDPRLLCIQDLAAERPALFDVTFLQDMAGAIRAAILRDNESGVAQYETVLS